MSNDRDGALVRLGASGSASLVGGANNDQLYAVAARGGGALAVGLARTFRGGGRNADPSLILTIPASGAPTAVVHENIPDLGLQPRAIDATPSGYVISGRFDTSEGYVGLLSATAQPGPTVRFNFPNATDVRVRQVRAAGAVSVVVGDVTTPASVNGFIVGFDSTTLATRYAYVVAAAGGGPVNLADVAVWGTSAVAVGAVNGDGLAVTFDVAAGAGFVTSLIPGMRLAAVVGPAPVLVAGVRSAGLVTARLTAAALVGTTFGGLSNPSNISPLPLLRVDDGAVVFGRTADAGIARLDLNADLRSGCDSMVSGTPFLRALQPDAGVTVVSTVPTRATFSVTVTQVPGLSVTPLSLAPVAACWP